jgi:ribosomal protein RSM22 (predicted rRNA methylase)
MVELPAELRAGLATAVERVPEQRLAQSVGRLIEAYRSGRPPTAPIMASGLDVAAYAAYRMPATFAAVRAALGQVVESFPDFDPRTHLDVGGGTGAATWAAAETFPGLTGVTVLDQVAGALDVGRKLAGQAPWPALRAAEWLQWSAGTEAELPAADLVTVSYVLGELAPDARDRLLDRAARAARLLVVVEPGTPAGYQRVIEARSALIKRDFTVVAPCPHQHDCPLAGTRDWCHFAARVNRSAIHRRLKQGELGHEDEKFSFVAAAAEATGDRPGGRVLRHPAFRKGMVTLQLCRPEDVAPRIVSKREGALYKAARDAEWGDAWPPAGTSA